MDLQYYPVSQAHYMALKGVRSKKNLRGILPEYFWEAGKLLEKSLFRYNP